MKLSTLILTIKIWY